MTDFHSRQDSQPWRDGREAQDHELAGGIAAPSLRPEADDGQWGELPENYDSITQPMGYLQEDDLWRIWRSRQTEEAERGGR
jgi:hypothetical protein